MFEVNTIHIELDAYENAALAHVIMLRLEYLTTQPATRERDEEIHSLVSICHKAMPQTSMNAAQERPGLN
jgi:hypothetical protein